MAASDIVALIDSLLSSSLTGASLYDLADKKLGPYGLTVDNSRVLEQLINLRKLYTELTLAEEGGAEEVMLYTDGLSI